MKLSIFRVFAGRATPSSIELWTGQNLFDKTALESNRKERSALGARSPGTTVDLGSIVSPAEEFAGYRPEKSPRVIIDPVHQNNSFFSVCI